MHHIKNLLLFFHKIFQILSSYQTREIGRIHSQEYMNPQSFSLLLSSSSLLSNLISQKLATHPDSLTEFSISEFFLWLHVCCIRYLWLLDIHSSWTTPDYYSGRHGNLKKCASTN